jgi:RNA polymerase sigma factor (sigma-70 family)
MIEKRVLVVDDEIAITEGLTDLFEFEQIESAAALDRQSAIAILDGRYFPVVLADLCLHSEAEGLALIDHVLRTSPRSKVVVLSAYATVAIEEQLLERGVSLVLQKPAAGDAIIEAIHALLAEIEIEAPEGEPVDLETLYLSVRRRLYDIPRRRFNLSHDRAEDVLHEAWLLFLQKRNYVRSVRPWLAGVVVNLSRQQIDQVKRRRETPPDELPFEEIVDPKVMHDADRLSLEQALGRIDARARTLCRLIAIEGLSYIEVSEATGLPVGSIGPTYLRAKRKLRELLSH